MASADRYDGSSGAWKYRCTVTIRTPVLLGAPPLQSPIIAARPKDTNQPKADAGDRMPAAN